MVCPLNKKIKVELLLLGDESSICADKSCRYNPKGFCEYHEVKVSYILKPEKRITGLDKYFLHPQL